MYEPGCPNSARISKLKAVPTSPDHIPNIIYNLPMSLWLVEDNHRISLKLKLYKKDNRLSLDPKSNTLHYAILIS